MGYCCGFLRLVEHWMGQVSRSFWLSCWFRAGSYSETSINGFGLMALAHAWAAAPVSERANLLLAGGALLWILGGTWASVLSLFHGVPFVLFGLAVVLDRSYPTWLGWFGFVGGLGSLLCGVTMFLGAGLVPEWLFIVFALVVSLWMVAMGVLMWRRAATRDKALEAD